MERKGGGYPRRVATPYMPAFKVEPIKPLLLVGPASDPPHLRGPLLKNTLFSFSIIMVPARDEPKCSTEKQ
jgi:hypothetical protein